MCKLHCFGRLNALTSAAAALKHLLSPEEKELSGGKKITSTLEIEVGYFINILPFHIQWQGMEKIDLPNKWMTCNLLVYNLNAKCFVHTGKSG